MALNQRPMPLHLFTAAATQAGFQNVYGLLRGSWYVQLKTGTTPDPGTAFTLASVFDQANASAPAAEITRGDGAPDPQYPRHMMIQAESDNARIRFDGVDPTASVGFLIYELSAPTIVTDWQDLGTDITEALSNIRMIGVSANTVINIGFFD